jgi:L-methionine (R)-S-oxide reductase
MPYLDALEGISDPQDLLDLTLEHFRADTGTLHLLEADGLLHLRASAGQFPTPVMEAIRIIPVGKGIAGQAVAQAKPVNICNIQTDAGGVVRPGARQIGVQGSICVPILVGERAVGALGIATHQEREFTQAEIDLLLQAGRSIGKKLWNS